MHEYVVDGDTGRPLVGVTVRFADAGVQAQTDAKGHFVLSVPTPPAEVPDGLGTDTLVYKKTGYKTIEIRDFGIAPEEMGGTGIEMEKGTGITNIDGTHKLMRK